MVPLAFHAVNWGYVMVITSMEYYVFLRSGFDLPFPSFFFRSGRRAQGAGRWAGRAFLGGGGSSFNDSARGSPLMI